MSGIKVTDRNIINLIIREVYYLSAGFAFNDVKDNLDEHLSTFGVEESHLTSLAESLSSGLADMGVEDRISFDLSVNLCIMDIYCLIVNFLKVKGVQVIEVEI